MKQMQSVANELINLAYEARKIAMAFDSDIDTMQVCTGSKGAFVLINTKDGDSISIMDYEDDNEVVVGRNNDYQHMKRKPA